MYIQVPSSTESIRTTILLRDEIIMPQSPPPAPSMMKYRRRSERASTELDSLEKYICCTYLYGTATTPIPGYCASMYIQVHASIGYIRVNGGVFSQHRPILPRGSIQKHLDIRICLGSRHLFNPVCPPADGTTEDGILPTEVVTRS